MFSKGSLLSGLIKKSALGTIVKALGTLIGFLFFVAVARLLSPEQYGVFSVGFSASLLLGTVASMGQEFAILRFWPAADELYGDAAAALTMKNGMRTVFRGCLAALLATCLVAIGIEVTSAGYSSSAVVAIGLLAAATALGEFVASALRARGSVLRALIPRDILWRPLVVAVAVALSIRTGPGALWITAILLITVVSLQVLLFLDITGQRSTTASSSTPDELIEQMRRATPGLWGVAIANSIGQHAATIAIGVVLGPVAAGGFFAASRLSQLMAMLLVAVNQVFGPLLSRSWHAGRLTEVRSLYLTAAAISFLGALFVFLIFVFLGKDILGFFGDDYSQAYSLLLVLSVGQLVNTACGPNRAFLMMVGREKILLALVASTSFALPLALPVAAHFHGAIAVAIVVAATTSILNIGALAVLFRIGGLRTSSAEPVRARPEI